jgi:hypothetical protein
LIEGAEGNVGNHKEGALKSINKSMQKLGRSVYLRMEESDVLVYWLSKPICSWQGIVPCEEVENGIGSEVAKCRMQSKSDPELIQWQTHAFII